VTMYVTTIYVGPAFNYAPVIDIAHDRYPFIKYIKKIKGCSPWPVRKKLFFSRLLFQKSGYLPWRLRRKKKDK